MYNHLINFIDKNKILYKYQFGFRKLHSTNHAIISLVEKVNNALDSGKILICVFLDLKKRLTPLTISILLDKLYKYGIRGTQWNWFKNYLENIKQYVCYSDISSVTLPITHGVPQGSILGPLLVILYINDLAGVSEKLFTILFADDTTILIEGTQVNSIITSLNSELAKLTDWLKANKLSINVSKTHYMVFHRSTRKLDKEDILLDNTIIKQVTFTKFLRIIIDDKLKWIHHISYIKNKISKGMGIILSQKSSEKESIITAIPFICDSISNILCRNLHLIYTCIRLITIQKNMLELLYSHHILLTHKIFLINLISFLSNTYFFWW